jgi:hypothetical protein
MAAQATPLRPSTPIAAVHAPVVVAQKADGFNYLRWLAAAPVLLLGGLVLLYGLGAMWKWGQVREAGLDPIDVLPLIPRDQLVTLGTELVLLTLVALPLTFGLVLVLHLALPDEGRAWGVPFGLARLTAEQDRLRRDIAELRAYAGHDELVARRARRMTTRSDRIRARLTHRTRAARLGLALAAVGGIAISTPGRIAVAAFGLWTIRRLGGGALRVALVVFAALMLVVLAERFAAPEPLPDASVRTTRGILVKAPLLTQTPDAWYLVVDERRLKAIPTGAIAKSSVAFAPQRDPGALGARPADALR